MKVCALLPMKKHSERIKDKNFREFNGKLLYRWILDTLLNVEDIDSIIINTDGPEKIDLSGIDNSNKIMVRKRKIELEGDFVSMNKIIEDDINSQDADIYLMTHTTNPLIQPATLNNAIKKFSELQKNKKYDSLFSVNKLQTRFYDKSVRPINHDPDNLTRTQDLEPWYEENSCFYLFTKHSFLTTNARIGKAPFMYELNSLESVDIDEPVDWITAESLAKNLGERFDIDDLVGLLSK